MVDDSLVPAALDALYEVHEWRNGLAILSAVHKQEWADIVSVLSSFRITRSEIQTPGGSKSEMAKKIDRALYQHGWAERSFDTKIVVDGVAVETPTHAVDCFKGKVALEVEWNNKDPFSIGT